MPQTAQRQESFIFLTFPECLALCWALERVEGASLLGTQHCRVGTFANWHAAMPPGSAAVWPAPAQYGLEAYLNCTTGEKRHEPHSSALPRVISSEGLPQQYRRLGSLDNTNVPSPLCRLEGQAQNVSGVDASCGLWRGIGSRPLLGAAGVLAISAFFGLWNHRPSLCLNFAWHSPCAGLRPHFRLLEGHKSDGIGVQSASVGPPS